MPNKTKFSFFILLFAYLEKNMRFGTLFILLFSLVLTGCFGSPGISLSKGDYDIEPPPNIHGAMRHVGKGDTLKAVVAGFGVGKKESFSGKIHNDSQKAGANNSTTLPAMDGRITYNLPLYSYFLEWHEINGTAQDNEWGAGFGLYPYPYVDFFGSINTSISEVGVFALFSTSFELVDYEGIAVDAPSTYKDAWQGDYDPEYVQAEDKYLGHGNVEIGAFLNFFIKNFTISYVPSIYFPWLFLDDLGKYNTTFFYPMLMIQDIQVNYNFSKWSVGAGFKDIVSNSLSGNYWQVLLNAVYYL